MSISSLVARKSITYDITVSVIIGIILTAGSYWLGLSQGWEKHLNWIEVGAVFTSYVSTWCSTMQRRFTYPAGVVSSVLYAWLFYDFHLVASEIVNIYLVFYLFYGYYRWRRDDNTRPITRVAYAWWPVYIIGSVAAYFAVYYIAKAFGGSFLWSDSLILLLTILAQVMLDNKKLENWIVWLAMDIFATWEYYDTHLYLVGFQYIFFTLNTVIAFAVWLRDYRKQKDDKIYIYNAKFDPALIQPGRGRSGFMRDFDVMEHVVAKRPCEGKNGNVCVAEGCYGHACERVSPQVSTAEYFH